MSDPRIPSEQIHIFENVFISQIGTYMAVKTQLLVERCWKSRNVKCFVLCLQKLPMPQVTVCNLNKIRLSRIPEEILQDFPQIISGSKLDLTFLFYERSRPKYCQNLAYHFSSFRFIRRRTKI